jgi:hypothetical protein
VPEPPLKTPDGRYLIVDGQLWRTTNPHLSDEQESELVTELMSARRAVQAALKSDDKQAERAARTRVHKAKVGLGERGPVWWEDGVRTIIVAAPRTRLMPIGTLH